MTKDGPDIAKRSFEFAVRAVRLSRELDQLPGTPKTLANQLLRSATSIGANLEEARSARSKADLTAKMYIACKEARETHYWLRLLTQSEIIPAQKLPKLKDEANQLVAILTTITNQSRPTQ